MRMGNHGSGRLLASIQPPSQLVYDFVYEMLCTVCSYCYSGYLVQLRTIRSGSRRQRFRPHTALQGHHYTLYVRAVSVFPSGHPGLIRAPYVQTLAVLGWLRLRTLQPLAP